jgi:hypothetical protein
MNDFLVILYGQVSSRKITTHNSAGTSAATNDFFVAFLSKYKRMLGEYLGKEASPASFTNTFQLISRNHPALQQLVEFILHRSRLCYDIM